MQSLYTQELILHYSYRRCVRRNHFPITVTAAVGTELLSNYSYSCGRGTERP